MAARVVENKAIRKNINLTTSYNSKINSKLFIKMGAQAELMNLLLDFRTQLDNPQWKQVWDFNDMTILMQAFAHVKYNFNEKITLNAGLHSQYLTLQTNQPL